MQFQCRFSWNSSYAYYERQSEIEVIVNGSRYPRVVVRKTAEFCKSSNPVSALISGESIRRREEEEYSLLATQKALD